MAARLPAVTKRHRAFINSIIARIDDGENLTRAQIRAEAEKAGFNPATIAMIIEFIMKILSMFLNK